MTLSPLVNVSKLLEKVARIRAFERLLLEEYKSGEIRGTIHTGIGQEYVPVILSDLAADAFWFSNHRGHAHFLSKTGNFYGLFAEILGFEGAVNGGIGGSQHLYIPGNFMSNGIQGGQLGMAVGISSKYAMQQKASIFFMGDGTTGAGHIYEALNLAKLHQSKILVILEDNEIAQSTPTRNTIAGDLANRFRGFGFEFFTWSPAHETVTDDLENLYSILQKGVTSMNRGFPTLALVKTSRLASHSKGDDNRKRDTITNLEAKDFLNRLITDGSFDTWDEIYREIESILNRVKSGRRIKGVVQRKIVNFGDSDAISNQKLQASASKMKDSINFALQEFISAHDTKLFGEDILDFPIPEGSLYGGAFKVTEGLSTKFPQAIQNFPISESAMIGFATGTALSGTSTIVEIMFSDFLSQCFDQIIHQVSKLNSIYGSSIELPLLIRTASGPGKGYGPTHSHTLESQLVGLPNIEVVSANPFIPYLEILNTWHKTRQCFIVFEPKNLYLNSSRDFDAKFFEICLPANIFNPVVIKPKHGQADLTILVYGSALLRVINQLDSILFKYEISIEVIIPTIISNWNVKTLHHSIQRNGGKLLVITDNLNSNGFQDKVIVEAFSMGILKKFESLNYYDWMPSGKLEDDYIVNDNSLIEIVMRLLQT